MDKKVTELRQKNQRFLAISVGITVGLVIVIVILLRLVGQKRRDFVVMKKTVNQLTAENASIAQTKSFLLQQQSNFDSFDQALPNQEDFVKFVQTIEKISESFAIDHSLHLSNPTIEGQYIYIPFSLILTMDSSQVVPFLRRFERIPYIAQIIRFSILTNEEIQQTEVEVGARVYVQKPFIE